MIKVHRTVYRTLWIAIAVIGAILVVSPLMLFNNDVRPHDPEEFRTTVVFSALAGAAMLVYAVWRLVRPLRAPPQE